jgi:hypothetical protein
MRAALHRLFAKARRRRWRSLGAIGTFGRDIQAGSISRRPTSGETPVVDERGLKLRSLTRGPAENVPLSLRKYKR